LAETIIRFSQNLLDSNVRHTSNYQNRACLEIEIIYMENLSWTHLYQLKDKILDSRNIDILVNSRELMVFSTEQYIKLSVSVQYVKYSDYSKKTEYHEPCKKGVKSYERKKTEKTFHSKKNSVWSLFVMSVHSRPKKTTLYAKVAFN
jgi:Na+-transporting NADH:ubiquinone oxidoreductase subunit NqrF